MQFLQKQSSVNVTINLEKVTPKCECVARIVSRRQIKMDLIFQIFQSRIEIFNFEPLFEGKK